MRTALAALPEGSTIIVALSGGADSLALAAATAFEASRLGLRAASLTVDHGLQDDSAEVAARVARTAAELGLDPLIVRVDVAGEGGPEAVVLREATRRVGVSPNAAYRHFADREALLAAVCDAAQAELAAAIDESYWAVREPDAAATARGRKSATKRWKPASSPGEACGIGAGVTVCGALAPGVRIAMALR